MHGNLKALRYWVSLLLAHTLTVTAHQLTFSKQHIAMTWLHRSMPCPTSCQVWQLESRKIPFQDRKISEDVPKKSTLDPYTGWKIRKWSPPYTNTFCCFLCMFWLLQLSDSRSLLYGIGPVTYLYWKLNTNFPKGHPTWSGHNYYQQKMTEDLSSLHLPVCSWELRTAVSRMTWGRVSQTSRWTSLCDENRCRHLAS